MMAKTLKINHVHAMYMLFAILFTLTGTSAFAADAMSLDRAMFTPNTNDFSLALMSQLFGELIQMAGGKTYEYTGNIFLNHALDPFSSMLKFFNVLCWVVGCGLLILNVIQNLTHAAEKKELGNLASTLYWVRAATGGGLLLPIKGSGYCLFNVLVMFLIINSIGAADTLLKWWVNIQDNPSIADIVKGANKSGGLNDLYYIKMPSPQVANLVYKTAEGYTCMYGLAAQKQAYDFKQNYDKGKDINIKRNSYAVTPANQRPKLISTYDSAEYAITENEATISAQLAGAEAALAANAKADFEARKQEHLNAEKQSFNQAKGQLNRVQMAALELFNVDIAQKDATLDGAFFFGMPNADTKAANNKQTRNMEVKATCGYIDFANRMNTNASDELMRKADVTMSKLREEERKKVEPILSSMKNNPAPSRKLPSSAEYNDKMMKDYLVVFNKYRGLIAQAASQYVDTINNNVRFVTNNKTGMLENAPLSNPDYELNRLNALDNFNQVLLNITKSLEKDVMNTMRKHSSFSDGQNGGLIAGYSFDKIPSFVNNNLSNQKANGSSQDNVDSRKIINSMAYNDGWMTTGMMGILIANSVQRMHSLSNLSPALGWASHNSNDYFSVLGSSVDNRYAKNAYVDIRNFYGFYDQIAQRSQHPSIVRSMNPPSGTANDVAALAFGLDLHSLTSTDRHPLILMVESGYSLMSAAQKFMTYSAYWTSRSDAVKGGNKEGAANPANPTTNTSWFLVMAMSAMLMLGFMLAFYLPALPFLIWISATLGWLVSAIEAVIIAPLWGAMHLSGEGSKLVGKAQNGYLLLVGLLFRAPLMVIGFAASFTILQVYGIYLNYVFSIGIMLSLGGAPTNEGIDMMGMSIILATYGMYFAFMQIVLVKIFNITTMFADQAMRWIGAPNGNLSEFGAMAGAEMKGSFQAFSTPFSKVAGQKFQDAGKTAASIDHATSMKANGGKLNMINTNEAGSAYKEMWSQDGYQGSAVGGELNTNANNGGYGYHKGHNPIPASEAERGEYKELQQNAYEVAKDANMSEDQARAFSNSVAHNGYNNPSVRSAFKNWNENDVFARDPARGYQALENYGRSGNQANGQDGLGQHLIPYVQSVSNSREPIRPDNLVNNEPKQSTGFNPNMPTNQASETSNQNAVMEESVPNTPVVDVSANSPSNNIETPMMQPSNVEVNNANAVNKGDATNNAETVNQNGVQNSSVNSTSAQTASGNSVPAQSVNTQSVPTASGNSAPAQSVNTQSVPTASGNSAPAQSVNTQSAPTASGNSAPAQAVNFQSAPAASGNSESTQAVNVQSVQTANINPASAQAVNVQSVPENNNSSLAQAVNFQSAPTASVNPALAQAVNFQSAPAASVSPAPAQTVNVQSAPAASVSPTPAQTVNVQSAPAASVSPAPAQTVNVQSAPAASVSPAPAQTVNVQSAPAASISPTPAQTVNVQSAPATNENSSLAQAVNFQAESRNK